MFNFQGNEVFVIFVLALIVLGPERLPEAMRKLGNFVAEVRKMTGGFQQEFKAVVDEPMRQMRESVDMIRDQTDIRKWQSESSPTPGGSAATDGSSGAVTPTAADSSASGAAPASYDPTPHVPTFDTDVIEPTSLVGDVDGFVVAASANTDLREWAPTRDAATANHTGDPEPPQAVYDSQLLRDFSPSRPVVNAVDNPVDEATATSSPSAGAHLDS